jgi:tetratricopeptide (TPR) repeat protein
MNLGVVCIEMGNMPAARSQMEDAQRMRERLLEGDPDSEIIRRDLAKGYFNLARVELALRDRPDANEDWRAWEEHHDRARDHLNQSLKSFESLPHDSPAALSDTYHLATCYHLLGRLTWDSGQEAEATRLYDEAIRLMQSLADENPDVHRYRGSLAGLHLEIGGLSSQRDDDESMANYEESRNIFTQLVGQYPDVPDYRTNLVTVLVEIGRHHLKRDQPDEAARVIYQSVEHLLQLEASPPEGSVYEQDLVQVLEVLALTYFDRGEAKKAIECVDWGLRLDPDNDRFRKLRQRKPGS